MKNKELETYHHPDLTLMAEEGASLSSGTLRLYALPCSTGQKPNAAIGCVDLYSYDPLNRRAAVGIMVASEHRRRGYALAMLHHLQELATSNYNLHTLYADIAAINTASLTLFHKAGYTECGRFREWLELDSHFIDNIRMQLILK